MMETYTPTKVEKIISRHSNLEAVECGQIVTVSVDRVYLQDGNAPTISKLFNAYGFKKVFNSSKIGVFFDHSVLAPDIQIANRLREAEIFAKDLGIQIFNSGEGISHIVASEMGWFEPGTIVIGSDSHTCTGAAYQCLALGMGASDCAAAMVTGSTWLRVPDTIWICVDGKPHPLTRARDIVFSILSKFGQEFFLYKSIEWSGQWVENLTQDSYASVANLTVEMGAKCAFKLSYDEMKFRADFLTTFNNRENKLIKINVDGLSPVISLPHSPENISPLNMCKGVKVNYVFIGTCTNGRLEDIAEAANILGNYKVHSSVKCLITPGSKKIYLDAIEKGYITKLIKAGAIISPPGCSACLGTQGSIPASGDVILSTMNRNFLGRMGNPQAKIYLASPAIAAYTAIYGEIPSLEDLPYE